MMPCPWARNTLSLSYHDHEWGVPVREDRTLFEFLILEGAQAGLSWDTILRRREAYRAAYEGFDPEKVARFTERDAARLLAEPADGQETIIRNRLKVAASIGNACAFLAVQAEFGGFAPYIWGFVGGLPRQNGWTAMGKVPASSPESAAMSKDLKRRGFCFVGATICYAFMQAVGMVNDHLVSCPRHRQVARLAKNWA